MESVPNLRLCVVAPSGSGKSTTAGFFRQAFERLGRSVAIAKLATPLYTAQALIYRECGRELEVETQDQSLLEAIATQMRRIDAESLIRNFQRRLNVCSAEVVINDDLRDDRTDYPWLRREGFRFVRIVASENLRRARLLARGDIDSIIGSPLDKQIARIRTHYVLVNNGTVADLKFQVDQLAGRLLRDVFDDGASGVA